ncbi:MAG: AmmeMemoRadiSam system protein B [Planctomycetes bacterium]|nr:AmmeMemoRadiSam system protein B [Planctomycetota bacterium]
MARPLPDLEHPAFRPLDVQQVAHGKDRGVILVDRLQISEPTFLGADLLPIVGRFDGIRSVQAICAAAAAQIGALPDADEVRELIRQLDERLLLLSPRFDQAVADQATKFLATGTRPTRHAGSAGYPEDPEQLRAALTAMVQGGERTPALRGLIAPHIDLERGTAGYAAAYGALLAAPPADLYVLFGTGHAGPEAPITGLPLDWDTPLGRVNTDRAFVTAVHRRIGPARPLDLLLHRDEHSLEFQTLLLQHLAERRGDTDFQVAAFLCGHLPTKGDPAQDPIAAGLVEAIRDAAAASSKSVCFVAGADLAHVGPFFGDRSPVTEPVVARLEQDERRRLAHLQAGDPGAFHAAVQSPGNPDRVCSATSIWLTATLAGGRANLLDYRQAVANDGSQTVGFAAATFTAD